MKYAYAHMFDFAWCFTMKKKILIHVRVYDFIISLAGALIHNITVTDV